MSDIFIIYGGHLHAGFTVYDAGSDTVQHYADDDCRDAGFNTTSNALVKLFARDEVGDHMYNVIQYRKIDQFFKIIDTSNHKVFNDVVVNIYHFPHKLPPRAFGVNEGFLHYRWRYFEELLNNGKFPPIYQQRILKNSLIIVPPFRNGTNNWKDISTCFLQTDGVVAEGDPLDPVKRLDDITLQNNISEEIYRRVDNHNDVCVLHLQDVDPQQALKFESQHTNEYVYTNESVVFNTRGNRVKNSIVI